MVPPRMRNLANEESTVGKMEMEIVCGNGNSVCRNGNENSVS